MPPLQVPGRGTVCSSAVPRRLPPDPRSALPARHPLVGVPECDWLARRHRHRSGSDARAPPWMAGLLTAVPRRSRQAGRSPKSLTPRRMTRTRRGGRRRAPIHWSVPCVWQRRCGVRGRCLRCQRLVGPLQAPSRCPPHPSPPLPPLDRRPSVLPATSPPFPVRVATARGSSVRHGQAGWRPTVWRARAGHVSPPPPRPPPSLAVCWGGKVPFILCGPLFAFVAVAEPAVTRAADQPPPRPVSIVPPAPRCRPRVW